MRIKKFIFKFKDYDRKETLVVSVELILNKKKQWKENEWDDNKHAMFAAKKALWKMKLIAQIKEMVRNKFFSSDSKFGDYKIVKKSVKKDCEIVNLNDKNDGEDVYRLTKMMYVKIIKLCRGTKPSDWHEVFDYPTKVHDLQFMLDSDEQSDSINLRELGKISYTLDDNENRKNTDRTNQNIFANMTNMAQTNTKNLGSMNVNQQGGKDYRDDYYKYKKAYLKLKADNNM